jgi:Uma2 family endonuclease
MSIATQQKLTLAEYLTYDDGTDARHELVDGVLVEMGAENPLNPQIAVFLLFAFADLGFPREQLVIGHQIQVRRFPRKRLPNRVECPYWLNKLLARVWTIPRTAH